MYESDSLKIGLSLSYKGSHSLGRSICRHKWIEYTPLEIHPLCQRQLTRSIYRFFCCHQRTGRFTCNCLSKLQHWLLEFLGWQHLKSKSFEFICSYWFGGEDSTHCVVLADELWKSSMDRTGTFVFHPSPASNRDWVQAGQLWHPP